MKAEDHILISGLLDGELTPEQSAALQKRLAGDVNLAKADARVAALKLRIARLPGAEVSPDFMQRIDAVVKPAPIAESTSGNWRQLAALLLLTALLSSSLTWSLTGRNAGFDEADAVAASHRRSLLAASPYDIASSDSHTVKPWLDAHIGISPPVVDLKADGFNLLGGRIDVIGDRPVPTLVYQYKEHLISVVAEPLQSGAKPASAAQHVNAGGMQIIHLSGSGFSYWVVSDTEWPILDGFVAKYFAKAGGASN